MKKITLLSLLVVFSLVVSSLCYAGELDEHWIGSIPEVLQLLEDENFKNISIYTKEENVVYYIERLNTSTSVHCHYHLDNNSTHCDNIVTGKDIPTDFEVLISVSRDNVEKLLEQLSVSPAVANEAVWPWVVGALVTYYFAKKLINYWVYKTFTPKPHSHNDFFIPKKDLEGQINQSIQTTTERFNGLESVFELSNPKIESQTHELNLLLERRILSLTQAFIQDVTHTYCTVCGHDHAGSHEHEDKVPFNFGFNLNANKTNVSESALLFSQNKQVFKSGFVLQRRDNVSYEENLDVKDPIERGVILKVTKAVLKDLKKELVDPIGTLLKGTYKTVLDKHNLKQLHSYIQTHYRMSLGESNYIAASAIALSLASIKVTGEAIESAFVGPYHIFCQISDAAVVGAGLGLFSAYHCLRQPIRTKNIALIFKSQFWSILFDRIKNPMDMTKNINDLTYKEMDIDKLFFNEINLVKKNIKTLIWQLRLDGQLSSQHANRLAKNLGQINKELEDLLFDIKLEENSSSQNLIDFVNKLQPIVGQYRYIYGEIFELMTPKEYVSLEVHLENSCLSFLK